MKGYVRFLIVLAVGLLVSFLIILSKEVFSFTSPVDVYKALTDAFFVSGALITCYGLLVVASNGGTFDMITYGIRRFFDVFRRDVMNTKYKTFYEYRKAKQEKHARYGYFVFAGLFLLGISFLFLALYYRAI